MGSRKELTVKEQTEQLRVIDEKTVEASLRKLRLNLAKLHLKGLLEKKSKLTSKTNREKDRQRKKELRQIDDFIQAGNVEVLDPGECVGIKH